MPSLRRGTLLLATGLVGSLLTLVPSTGTAAPPPANHPRTPVIVELKGEAAIAAVPGAPRNARASAVKAERVKLATKQRTFLASARESGVTPTSVRRFELLLNAVAMTVDARDVAKLRRMPGVKSVSPAGISRAMDTDANDVVGNPAVWAQEDPSGIKATGEGVTVAVIDTGVDYTHPDLGGGFGAGHKVVGGWDFVNNDADPMDDNSHGTHVAGIVAGKPAAAGGVTGAAPDAELLAYKVLGANGSGDDTGIIAAIEAAVDPANPHRADIINMSLGNSAGTASDPLSRAASAAVDAGALVFASAGNSGPGYWTVGSPAAAPGVIAVGASTSGIRLPVLTVAGDTLLSYRGGRSANPPAEAVTAGVVNIGMGTPEDWETAGDVSGKIVLYAIPPAVSPYDVWPEELDTWREAERRGAIALVGGVGGGGGGPVMFGDESRTNPLQPRGDQNPRSLGRAPSAKREVLLGATPAESGDSLRMDKLVLAGVDYETGQQLASLAESGGELTLSGRDSTDEMASFSSRGPDTELLGLKPEIVAPGVEILSTVPKSIEPEGYQRMSGTSMASPLAAGSAALLRQLHPDRPADRLRAEVIGSTMTLDGPDIPSQGSGRLDTAAAAATGLYASPATVSFGLPHMDQPKVTGSREVTLHNTGGTPVSGTVTVTGPATASPDHVDIPAGGTATVTLTVERDRPDVTDYATNYLSGRVTVTPEQGRHITVPYLMTAIPLYVDTAEDPSIDGSTTVYVYSPTPLTAPPVLTVTPPKGAAFTKATVPTADPYYHRAEFTGLGSGVHTMTARATTSTAVRQYGTGAFEVTLTASKVKRWKAIGPNSAVGTTQLAPGAPKQAVMTQGTRPGA